MIIVTITILVVLRLILTLTLTTMFFKASDAFKTWKKTTSKERASILRKIGDLVLENKVYRNLADQYGNFEEKNIDVDLKIDVDDNPDRVGGDLDQGAGEAQGGGGGRSKHHCHHNNHH